MSCALVCRVTQQTASPFSLFVHHFFPNYKAIKLSLKITFSPTPLILKLVSSCSAFHLFEELEELSITNNMHYQQLSQVWFFQKLIIIIFLSLIVCGEKEETLVVGINDKSPTMQARQRQKQKQGSLRNSFDSFISSKRKVPNASDPLHNR